MRYLILTISFLLFSTVLLAQKISPVSEADGTSQDSLSVQEKRSSLGTIFKGKPGRAALYSLIIPGAGQAYNRSWWKVPLAIGLDVTAASVVYYYTGISNRYSECYESFLPDPVTGEDQIISTQCGLITIATDAFDTRNRARSRKEYSWMFFVGAHLLQTIEAYIDRHLIDFDVDENLSFFEPTQIDQYNFQPTVQYVTIRIPLNKKTVFAKP